MDKENIVGKNIRMYRESRDMYQEELAAKLGVTSKAVSAWENGKAEPRMGVILKMCTLFGCSVKDLTEKRDAWANTPVQDRAMDMLRIHEAKQMNDLAIEAARKLTPELSPNENKIMNLFKMLTPENQEALIKKAAEMYVEQ